jgi:hypothetical protein
LGVLGVCGVVGDLGVLGEGGGDVSWAWGEDGGRTPPTVVLAYEVYGVDICALSFYINVSLSS